MASKVQKSTLKISTIEDSVNTKSFWLGSTDLHTESDYILNYKDGKPIGFKLANLEYYPRIFKGFEEVLINAADQRIKNNVTKIEVSSANDNSFIVTNIGSGFNVAFHDDLKDWEPFIQVAYFFQGAETTKPPNSIIGGTNGLGFKLFLRECKWLMLTTIDHRPGNNKLYVQFFKHKPGFYERQRENVRDTKTFDPEGLPFTFTIPLVIDLDEPKYKGLHEIEVELMFKGAMASTASTASSATNTPDTSTSQKLKRKVKIGYPYTTIQFQPLYSRYKLLEILDKPKSEQEKTPKQLERAKKLMGDFRGKIEMRCYQLAAYINCPVSFNTSVISVANIADYAKMALPDVEEVVNINLDPLKIKSTIFGPDVKKKAEIFARPAPKIAYPIDIAIAIKETPSKFLTWSIINSVEVQSSNLTTFINAQVIDRVKERLSKYFSFEATSKDETKSDSSYKIPFNEDIVLSAYNMYISASIASPEWASQTKNTVKIDKKFLEENYKIDAKDIDSIISKIESKIKEKYFAKVLKINSDTLEKTRKKISRKDYIESAYSTSKNWNVRKDSILVLCEGLSASQQFRKILNIKDSPYNPMTTSIFPIGGVPTNIRKMLIEQIAEIRTVVGTNTSGPKASSAKSDASSLNDIEFETDIVEINTNIPKNLKVDRFIFSRKYYSSEKIHVVLSILGFDINKTYKSDAEFQTLVHGHLDIATDQDLDGFNISMLLVSMIELIWPALIKRGYIRIVQTNLINVFKEDRLITGFRSDDEFRFWAFKQGYFDMIFDDFDKLEEFLIEKNKDKNYSKLQIAKYIRDKYKPKGGLRAEYFKGLGSSTLNIYAEQFGSGKRALYVLDLDSKGQEYFDKLFNYDSTPRKVALRDKSIGLGEKLIVESDFHVKCSNFLLGPYLEFCKDNLCRKLPSALDMLNDIKRRIIYTAMTISMNSYEFMKVFQFGADVTKRTGYHHGDASMSESITKLASNCFGSYRLPLLRARGGTVNRIVGADAAASPRYLTVRPNTELINLLYRKEDLNVLPFLSEEGVTTVPQYYVSIIPPLFESTFLPAHGWNVRVIAINSLDLIKFTIAAVEAINADLELSNSEVIQDLIKSVADNNKLRIDINGWKGSIKKIEIDPPKTKKEEEKLSNDINKNELIIADDAILDDSDGDSSTQKQNVEALASQIDEHDNVDDIQRSEYDDLEFEIEEPTPKKPKGPEMIKSKRQKYVRKYSLNKNGKIDIIVSFGNVTLRDNIVTVTELPHDTIIQQYKNVLDRMAKQIGDNKFDHPFIENYQKTPSSSINDTKSSGITRDVNEINIQFAIKRDKLEVMMQSATLQGVEIKNEGAKLFALMVHIKLFTYMMNNLNYFSEDRTVLEFEKPLDVITYWFPKRKFYYELQIKVEIMISLCEIILLLEQNRYVAKYYDMKIAGIADDELATRVLEENRFIKFNDTKLREAHRKISINKFIEQVIGFDSYEELVDVVGVADKATRGDIFKARNQDELKALEAISLNGFNVQTEKLKSAIDSKDINYDYLLGLKDNQKYKTTIAKRNEKIEELLKRLEHLMMPGSYKEVWIGELKKLEALLSKHLPNMWEDMFDVKTDTKPASKKK